MTCSQPVIPIIRNNVPGAIVSTPPVCGGDTSWMTSWMTLENTNGRLSDYYGIHVYLKDYTPEVRMGMVQHMLDTKNANGWTTTPWMNTETGYDIYHVHLLYPIHGRRLSRPDGEMARPAICLSGRPEAALTT